MTVAARRGRSCGVLQAQGMAGKEGREGRGIYRGWGSAGGAMVLAVLGRRQCSAQAALRAGGRVR
eukprot:207144-Chlamydomonas_euryale.AAC.14